MSQDIVDPSQVFETAIFKLNSYAMKRPERTLDTLQFSDEGYFVHTSTASEIQGLKNLLATRGAFLCDKEGNFLEPEKAEPETVVEVKAATKAAAKKATEDAEEV